MGNSKITFGTLSPVSISAISIYDVLSVMHFFGTSENGIRCLLCHGLSSIIINDRIEHIATTEAV
jgi:hypothetical protein